MTEQMGIVAPPPQAWESRRYYRVERHFCNERHSREMVQNLLRAHSAT